jgi:Penicillin binding protein transpeptidase domain
MSSPSRYLTQPSGRKERGLRSRDRRRRRTLRPAQGIWLFIITAVLVSSSPQVHAALPSSASTLFAQSVVELLKHAFPNPEVSYLLLDVTTGAVLAQRWENVERPIPPGSLLKPFAALAYGEQHDFKYPALTCRGSATGCWLPRGHGPVDFTSATAYSCNSYFRALTANMTASEVAATATRFGLEAPPAECSGPELAGIGNRWLISPLRLARAYLELSRRRDQPGVRQILEGMAQSAREGTAAEIDRALSSSRALAKTGTAACTHEKRAPGDGFVVALFPADEPQILLMVRVHGVPGSRAAKTAGAMLRQIEE